MSDVVLGGMRMQTGADPLKRATIVVEWEDGLDSAEVVRQTIEETLDGLLAALRPLGVAPTITMVTEGS